MSMADAASEASMVPIGMIDRNHAATREARLSAGPPSIIAVCTKLHIRPASSAVSSIVTLGIQASGNVGLSRSSAMSRLCLSLTVAALAASLTCGVGLAQSIAPAPNPALKTQASSEPSTAAKVENWTKKQWNAAKQKWSQDKAKWNACNQDTKDQKLSGRKSWSYLYDCMTKA
jgi:hypothetical protein